MWFRRDLRLHDNHALSLALAKGNVMPVFIFDTGIIRLLEKDDQRVGFIHSEITRLHEELVAMGSALMVFHGSPVDIFSDLLKKYRVDAVYCNNDHEPYTIKRDNEVEAICSANRTAFIAVKDHLIFERNDILKPDGKPYTVFTPYSRKWKALLKETPLTSYENGQGYLQMDPAPLPSLASLGFDVPRVAFPSSEISDGLIRRYAAQRDQPGAGSTSRLGIHLRFGTVSIREVVGKALSSDVFLNELIWREFFQAILWHFPHVVDHAFRAAYDNIEWRNNENEFERWCNGATGYPLVDAGMRELNETGFMHNRVRMVAASFLCKHLLIDWRWGESYFAAKLLDYELASNNGNWQWAAGSGCDAAPYFRIFNPALQAKKFDPGSVYIRRWIPEIDNDYPPPVVEHEFARKRCLEVYSKALKQHG